MDQAHKKLQEHIGLAKVHEICARMNAVWRPTPSVDIGIDGQIEILELDSVVSTGKIIAVQVKSGSSYFENQSDEYVPYYPSAVHRKYWRRLRLPVLLVLHDTQSGSTYYEFVKAHLDRKGPILVSKRNILMPTSRLDLLRGYDSEEVVLARQLDPEKVLSGFQRISVALDVNVEFTGIHFLLACFNLDPRFFELRQARLGQVMHFISTGNAIGIGAGYYDFLLRCVIKCWIYGLTEPFEEEFEATWYDLQMVPDIAAPLTVRGDIVISYLLKHAKLYVPENFSQLANTAEDYARMVAAMAQGASERLDRSDRLGEEPR